MSQTEIARCIDNAGYRRQAEESEQQRSLRGRKRCHGLLPTLRCRTTLAVMPGIESVPGELPPPESIGSGPKQGNDDGAPDAALSLRMRSSRRRRLPGACAW